MRRLVATLLLATLTAFGITSVAAAPNGKSANQNPNIKVLPKKERVPLTIARTCDERKSSCPKVNSFSQVQDIELCKIKDLTEDWRVSSGFPRYKDAIIGAAKIDVLVMVFEFQDKKFANGAYKILQKEAKKTEELYERISNGVIDLNFVFPKESEWVRFPGKNADYLPQMKSGMT